MIFKGKTNEVLILEELEPAATHRVNEVLPGSLTILWMRNQKSKVKIDERDYFFSSNQIVCLTEFHHVEVDRLNNVRLVRFNRSFYCIRDHDDEVSCKGMLFYGASHVPVITIPPLEVEKFELLWKMFSIEMNTDDNLQLEMLQMMLKRLIIICTRLYKEQHEILSIPHKNLDIVREFNYLVETHFRSKHAVSEYAEMLNKSPKTLSNLFAQFDNQTPLQLIQGRIMLEARRLLRYTDKPVKEIAYEIGYDDIQTFSRFFKGKEGISPKEFRETGKEKLLTQ